jgi:hypothetical protein
MKKEDYLGDIRVDGRKILKLILKWMRYVVHIVIIWLRICSNDGTL